MNIKKYILIGIALIGAAASASASEYTCSYKGKWKVNGKTKNELFEVSAKKQSAAKSKALKSCQRAGKNVQCNFKKCSSSESNGSSGNNSGGKKSVAETGNSQSPTPKSRRIAGTLGQIGESIKDFVNDPNTALYGQDHSKVYVQNKCNRKIKVASYYISTPANNGRYFRWRWDYLEPGQSKYIANTRNRYVYFYAESFDGSLKWTGSECFKNNSRTLCTFQTDMGSKLSNYTQGFTCN